MAAKRGPRRKFGATQKHRIFLVVLPDAETAARIHALAQALKVEQGLEGTQIRPEHLHVTLFHLGDWIGLPAQIVEIAGAAAAKVEAPSFEVAFDRAESFRNSTGVYPFVLLGDRDAAALRTFHAALGAQLKAAGLGGATQGDFKPHVTLLRDAKRVKAVKIVPVTWTVREFVLVHSELGKTTHHHLARWALRAAT